MFMLNIFRFYSPAAVEEIPELKKQKIDKTSEALDQLIAAQNKEFYSHRDFIQSKLQRSNWIQLLEVNKQSIPKANDEVCFNKLFIVINSQLFSDT